MPLDLVAISVLAVPIVKQVFEQVVRKRAVRFGDLVKLVGDRDATKTALDKLKDASLINEVNSVIEDFNTYYVTADGLEMSRRVGA